MSTLLDREGDGALDGKGCFVSSMLLFKRCSAVLRVTNLKLETMSLSNHTGDAKTEDKAENKARNKADAKDMAVDEADCGFQGRSKDKQKVRHCSRSSSSSNRSQQQQQQQQH